MSAYALIYSDSKLKKTLMDPLCGHDAHLQLNPNNINKP